MSDHSIRTKTCRKCGETKPATEFGRDRRYPDGRLARCKACRSAARRVWHAARHGTLAIPEVKVCKKCSASKPARDFNKGVTNADGLTSWCKTCRSAYALKRSYGMTLEFHQAEVDRRRGCCDICGTHVSRATHRTSVLAVDHCHATGVYRGMLCDTCNRGIGMFQDNPELLLKAYHYLLQTEVADGQPTEECHVGVDAQDPVGVGIEEAVVPR